SQLFFLAFQIKTDNDVRLLRRWSVAVVAPFELALRAVVDTAGGALEDYLALYDVQQENKRLQAELEETRLRLYQAEAQAGEAEQLASLLDLKQAHAPAPLLAARVINASFASTSRTVLIDRGHDDGLRPNMVALTPEGVVGKVVNVFPGTARVLLVTDSRSGVGVELAASGLKGVLKGNGGSLCRLEYIPAEEFVPEGASLVTSGQDQLFPRGLPVGRVVSVEAGGGDRFFLSIEVEPSAPLARLSHLLVLAGPPETLTLSLRSGPDSSAGPNGPREPAPR
ncbi:MAG: rod shape-determining protein MreC, partial [Terriglobia bacterium]